MNAGLCGRPSAFEQSFNHSSLGFFSSGLLDRVLLKGIYTLESAMFIFRCPLLGVRCSVFTEREKNEYIE